MPITKIKSIPITTPHKPYPAQIITMSKIITCLSESSSCLIESPTGTGKTHAILCSVLGHMRSVRLGQDVSCSIDMVLNSKNSQEISTNINGVIGGCDSMLGVGQQVGELVNVDIANNIHNTNNLQKLNSTINLNTLNKINNSTNSLNSMSKIKQEPISKIYVCSRTHKQIDQMIDQLKQTIYKPRIAILASRSALCINPILKYENDKNTACANLLKTNSCSFYINREKLALRINSDLMSIGPKKKGKKSPLDDIMSGFEDYESTLIDTLLKDTTKSSKNVVDDAMLYDLEDLKLHGKKCNGCPFFASRILADEAEIVFAPYNYLIDPVIRRAMNINLKNSVIIVDEAHNIEDFCRGAGSVELTRVMCEIVSNEIMKTLKKGFRSEDVKRDMFFVMDVVRKFKEYGENKNDDKDKDRDKDSDDVVVEKKSYNKYNSKRPNYNNNKFNSNNDNKNDSRNDTEKSLFKGKNIITLLESISITSETVLKLKECLARFSKSEEHKDIISNTTLVTLESLATALEIILFSNPESYAFCKSIVSTDTYENNSGFKLNFWLLDPAVIFLPLARSVRSIMLLSGTLTPFSGFSSELGFYFKHVVEAPHIVGKDSVFVGTVERGHLDVEIVGKYGMSENFAYLEQVKRFILEVRDVVKDLGGTLVFVPSYAFLENLVKRIKGSSSKDYNNKNNSFGSKDFNNKNNIFGGKDFNNKNNSIGNNKKSRCEININYINNDCPKNISSIDLENVVFVEPRDNVTFTKTFAKYKKSIEKREGPIMLCVYRGRASEGMDFKDSYARAVIAVGIPYPSYKDMEIVCKREYNDKYKEVKGQAWYEIQAFRAINQAIGRIMRHREDWGGVFLLDKRYSESRNLEMMPKWVKSCYKVYGKTGGCVEEFRKFVEMKRNKIDK